MKTGKRRKWLRKPLGKSNFFDRVFTNRGMEVMRNRVFLENPLFTWLKNNISKHTKRKILRGWVVPRKKEGSRLTFNKYAEADGPEQGSNLQ